MSPKSSFSDKVQKTVFTHTALFQDAEKCSFGKLFVHLTAFFTGDPDLFARQDSSLLPSVCRYMIRSSMRTIPVAMVKSDSTERFRSAVSSKKR